MVLRCDPEGFPGIQVQVLDEGQVAGRRRADLVFDGIQHLDVQLFKLKKSKDESFSDFSSVFHGVDKIKRQKRTRKPCDTPTGHISLELRFSSFTRPTKDTSYYEGSEDTSFGHGFLSYFPRYNHQKILSTIHLFRYYLLA